MSFLRESGQSFSQDETSKIKDSFFGTEMLNKPSLTLGLEVFSRQLTPDYDGILDDNLKNTLEIFDRNVIDKINPELWPILKSQIKIRKFWDAWSTQSPDLAEELWFEMRQARFMKGLFLDSYKSRESEYVDPDRMRMVAVISHVVGGVDGYADIDWKAVKLDVQKKLGNNHLSELINSKIRDDEKVAIKQSNLIVPELDIEPTNTIIPNVIKVLRRYNLSHLATKEFFNIPKLGPSDYRDMEAYDRDYLIGVSDILRKKIPKHTVSLNQIGMSERSIHVAYFLSALVNGDGDKFYLPQLLVAGNVEKVISNIITLIEKENNSEDMQKETTLKGIFIKTVDDITSKLLKEIMRIRGGKI
ncbi:hypothetical protein LBMAG33_3460 [Candidatus Levyibacteriota bacterium]|nr:hypothetical protein LBMAG33_3460 [Candidatus Levybacteria bacterium]